MSQSCWYNIDIDIDSNFNFNIDIDIDININVVYINQSTRTQISFHFVITFHISHFTFQLRIGSCSDSSDSIIYMILLCDVIFVFVLWRHLLRLLRYRPLILSTPSLHRTHPSYSFSDPYKHTDTDTDTDTDEDRNFNTDTDANTNTNTKTDTNINTSRRRRLTYREIQEEGIAERNLTIITITLVRKFFCDSVARVILQLWNWNWDSEDVRRGYRQAKLQWLNHDINNLKKETKSVKTALVWICESKRQSQQFKCRGGAALSQMDMYMSWLLLVLMLMSMLMLMLISRIIIIMICVCVCVYCCILYIVCCIHIYLSTVTVAVRCQNDVIQAGIPNRFIVYFEERLQSKTAELAALKAQRDQLR